MSEIGGKRESPLEGHRDRVIRGFLKDLFVNEIRERQGRRRLCSEPVL